MFKEEITQYCLMCQEWAEKYEKLEAENEELKAKFQDMKKSRDVALKEYNEEFEYKRQITVEHLEQKKELLKQLDQLKVANEHLAEKEKEVRHYLKEAYKYRKTLTEIKEIAKKTLNMVDYKTYFKRDNKSLKQEGFKALNEILQKINECEVENDNA